MEDAGIGRLLVASLHQGIADVAPLRLAFYEHWLVPAGLRQGKFGLAPLHAVLSFLRLEGRSQYDRIMRAAGHNSADWAYEEVSAPLRASVHALPVAWRARAVLHLSRRVIRDTFRGSRGRVRLKDGQGSLQINASLFCQVREEISWPLCAFYAAAVERFLWRFALTADVTVTACRASGDDRCCLTVVVHSHRPVAMKEGVG